MIYFYLNISKVLYEKKFKKKDCNASRIVLALCIYACKFILYISRLYTRIDIFMARLQIKKNQKKALYLSIRFFVKQQRLRKGLFFFFLFNLTVEDAASKRQREKKISLCV